MWPCSAINVSQCLCLADLHSRPCSLSCLARGLDAAWQNALFPSVPPPEYLHPPTSLQALTSFGVLVKLRRKRLFKQENEICHKWLHYSRVRGRAFIVFPLMHSLWNSTRKRVFCPEGSCQVSGRLKTVWTGYQPSQLSVLPDSDAALSLLHSHVGALQTVSVLGSSDCLVQIY